jgi:uncharacterized membrane protein
LLPRLRVCSPRSRRAATPRNKPQHDARGLLSSSFTRSMVFGANKSSFIAFSNVLFLAPKTTACCRRRYAPRSLIRERAVAGINLSICMKHFPLKRFDLILRLVIGSLFLGIFFLAAYAPIIQGLKGYPAGEEIYTLFRPICHEYPTRSLWILDRPWALCARCSFGYFGVALAALFVKSTKPYRTRVITGVILLSLAAIDPIVQLFTSYESTNSVRVLSGLIGGCGTFLIFYPLTRRTSS